MPRRGRRGSDRDLLLEKTADATVDESASGERTTLRGCTVVPEVYVTVPVMTLLGRTEEPGQLGGYGPIDPETARWLTADAPSLYRPLTQPETQAVLSLGAEHYEVPAALRRYLQVRNEHCRYPGGRAVRHRPRAPVGPRWTHRPRQPDLPVPKGSHRQGPGVAGPDGTVIWTSPYGRVRITRPATTIGWTTAA